MVPDVDSVSSKPDRDDDTRDVSHPMTVMIERETNIRMAQLLGLGPCHARIRTQTRLRDGEPCVLTVSVPESRSEKTQAMFRLSSRVRDQRRHGNARDYVVHFDTEERNLDRADQLYARFRACGIVEV